MTLALAGLSLSTMALNNAVNCKTAQTIDTTELDESSMSKYFGMDILYDPHPARATQPI